MTRRHIVCSSLERPGGPPAHKYTGGGIGRAPGDRAARVCAVRAEGAGPRPLRTSGPVAESAGDAVQEAAETEFEAGLGVALVAAAVAALIPGLKSDPADEEQGLPVVEREVATVEN